MVSGLEANSQSGSDVTAESEVEACEMTLERKPRG